MQNLLFLYYWSKPLKRYTHSIRSKRSKQSKFSKRVNYQTNPVHYLKIKIKIIVTQNSDFFLYARHLTKKASNEKNCKQTVTIIACWCNWSDKSRVCEKQNEKKEKTSILSKTNFTEEFKLYRNAERA